MLEVDLVPHLLLLSFAVRSTIVQQCTSLINVLFSYNALREIESGLKRHLHLLFIYEMKCIPNHETILENYVKFPSAFQQLFMRLVIIITRHKKCRPFVHNITRQTTISAITKIFSKDCSVWFKIVQTLILVVFYLETYLFFLHFFSTTLFLQLENVMSPFIVTWMGVSINLHWVWFIRVQSRPGIDGGGGGYTVMR